MGMKFKLKANPTFKAEVGIPVAGETPQKIVIEFQHRTASQMQEFIESSDFEKMDNLDFIKQMAVGWEGVDAEFNEENIKLLIDEFPRAPSAIRDVYLFELIGAKIKN